MNENKPSAGGWDEDCYSAEYSPLIRLNPSDAIGMAEGLGVTTDRDQMQWPVSWDQIESWGGKADDKIAWTIEGPNLCYFSINGARVARGEKSPLDGSYLWTALV